MLRLRVLTLTACVLVMGTFLVRAQDDDLKAVLRKSIEAHGGAKNLEKHKAVISKFKGTLEIQGLKFDITGETSLQKPDKVKNVMKLEIKGKEIDVVTVFDGKKLWVSTMGQTKEIDDEKTSMPPARKCRPRGPAVSSNFSKPPTNSTPSATSRLKAKTPLASASARKGRRT